MAEDPTSCRTTSSDPSLRAAAAARLFTIPPLLVNHFVERAANTLGKPAPAVPPASNTPALRTASISGNVPELDAMVSSAATDQQGSVSASQSFKDRASRATSTDRYAGAAPAPMDSVCGLTRAERPTRPRSLLVSERLRRAERNQGDRRSSRCGCPDRPLNPHRRFHDARRGSKRRRGCRTADTAPEESRIGPGSRGADCARALLRRPVVPDRGWRSRVQDLRSSS